ncbi:MAG: hypothetical protein KF709_08360 [Gemmatimonadaceae bacterium]|nr:hypothetical protein [Gemmatimonadaceae bacterium]
MSRTNGLALAFFAAAFAAGVAAGVATDRMLVRERAQEQWGDQSAMRARLADDLGMTPEQRTQLDSVLDERERLRDSIMDPVRPKLDSLGTRARQGIRQLLNPGQQAIYDQMLREREEARRQEKRQ